MTLKHLGPNREEALMAQATIEPPKIRTLADLRKRLGNIPLDRIRFEPAPGTATVKNLIELDRRGDSLCELVDGTLVEKAVGAKESNLAWFSATGSVRISTGTTLGHASPPTACCGSLPGLVRIPDLSFVSWDKLPGRMVPEKPVPALVPDLAVEVLSEGNTPAEMKRKVGEYFDAGVGLVWLIDPEEARGAVYTAPHRSVLIREDQSLDGGDVLPGFSVALADLLRRILPAEEMTSDPRSADT